MSIPLLLDSGYATELKDLSVNFFPNPVKDKCYITIDNKNNESIVVKLFNTSGKLMMSKKKIKFLL